MDNSVILILATIASIDRQIESKKEGFDFWNKFFIGGVYSEKYCIEQLDIFKQEIEKLEKDKEDWIIQMEWLCNVREN